MSGGIVQKIFSVSAWTFLSRILGFVRDKFIAHFLGASLMADAFFIAFRVPNLFRRFLAEGAFNSGFIPEFRERAHDRQEAARYARHIFTSLLAVTLVLIAFVFFFTPVVVKMLASGFFR